MNRKFSILLIVITPLLGQCQSATFDEKLSGLLKGTVPLISSSEAYELLEQSKNVVIYDTRSIEEFSVSTIKNAQFVDFQTFDISKIPAHNKQDTIIVYCTVGYRSEQIGEALLKAGYNNTYNLYGGIFGWMNAGYAVFNNNDVKTDSVHTYNKSWSKWLEKGVKVYE